MSTNLPPGSLACFIRAKGIFDLIISNLLRNIFEYCEVYAWISKTEISRQSLIPITSNNIDMRRNSSRMNLFTLQGCLKSAFCELDISVTFSPPPLKVTDMLIFCFFFSIFIKSLFCG